MKAPSLRIDFIYKFRLSHHICSKQAQYFLASVGSYLRHFCTDGTVARDTSRSLSECTAPYLSSCQTCSIFSGIFTCSFIKAIRKDIQCPLKLADNTSERNNRYREDCSRQPRWVSTADWLRANRVSNWGGESHKTIHRMFPYTEPSAIHPHWQSRITPWDPHWQPGTCWTALKKHSSVLGLSPGMESIHLARQLQKTISTISQMYLRFMVNKWLNK